MIPNGLWRCKKGHVWAHPPGQTKCPACGAIDGITWVNWPEVEAAILKKTEGRWPGWRGRKKAAPVVLAASDEEVTRVAGAASAQPSPAEGKQSRSAEESER